LKSERDRGRGAKKRRCRKNQYLRSKEKKKKKRKETGPHLTGTGNTKLENSLSRQKQNLIALAKEQIDTGEESGPKSSTRSGAGSGVLYEVK